MTPDDRQAYPNLVASGRFRAREVDGTATLFLEAAELVIRVDEDGAELSAPWALLSGATWRGDTLAIHADAEALHLRGDAALDRAWYGVMQRACRLPEVTRGLRWLGARRGGSGALQSRFFGPLLQARRRLLEGEPLDWQVAGFDAGALTERLTAAMASLASERRPDHPAHRRALEAQLLEAAEPVLERLRRLGQQARLVHESNDAERFIAWRRWSGEVRQLFADADRSWGQIVTALGDAS